MSEAGGKAHVAVHSNATDEPPREFAAVSVTQSCRDEQRSSADGPFVLDSSSREYSHRSADLALRGNFLPPLIMRGATICPAASSALMPRCASRRSAKGGSQTQGPKERCSHINPTSLEEMQPSSSSSCLLLSRTIGRRGVLPGTGPIVARIRVLRRPGAAALPRRVLNAFGHDARGDARAPV